MGWASIRATVAATLDDAILALRAEDEENGCRLDMTLSERTELGRRIEAIERERARERERSGINQYTEPCGKLPQGSVGKTRNKMDATGKVDPAFRELARRRSDRPEPKPEPDDEPDPNNLRVVFLLRVDTAIKCAQFTGKPTKESVRVARRAAEVWAKLADELEAMRSGGKSRNQ